MNRVFKTLIAFGMFAALLALGACAWLERSEFGAYPAGVRLLKLQRSPNHVTGEFRNLVETPMLREGEGLLSIQLANLRQHVDDLRPSAPIPAVKTNLHDLDPTQDSIVWLGHSSFFLTFAGKRILIDPVLSPYAAPVSFANQAFDGTSLYTPEDIPAIDLLLITHDHWDHLDHATVTALKSRIGHTIVPLGVGAHFERWGYREGEITEADWYDKLVPAPGLAVHLIPARHYSGRWLTRNKTLWTGFVLESATRRILFSGDTGYGPHFREIGQRFGGFDLAALDMGQYDPRWPYIHMTPEEAAQAAEDLGVRALLPAHIGRFRMAKHAWYEPFERISVASQNRPYQLATPRIGEPLKLEDSGEHFARWWQEATRLASSDAVRNP